MIQVTPLPHASAEELAELGALAMRSKAHWGYDADFMEACRPVLRFTPEKLAAEPMAVTRDATGFAGLASVSVEGEIGHLEKLFIDPPHIGQGHGNALFAWPTAKLSGMGATHMLIEADPQAAPFYERMGAKLIGGAPSGVIPGRVLPLFQLEF